MKQYYCFLERFNNYFNRKIIKFETLTEYQNNSKSSFIPTTDLGAMTPFDFNPNDNVTTEIIANSVPFDPDYFLLLDEDQNIIQRWFVLEQKRNRQGQWLYQLKRDVVSDNLETLIDAPIFVEKGMLPDDDPMVLNSEGMSLNQIKTSEQLLKDETGSSYIVAYIAKNATLGDVTINASTEEVTNYKTLSDIATDTDIAEDLLEKLVNLSEQDSNYAFFTTLNRFTFNFYTGTSNPRNLDVNGAISSGSGNATSIFDVDINILNNPFIAKVGDTVVGWLNTYNNAIITNLRNNKTNIINEIKSINNRDYYLDESQLERLKVFEGQIIYYLGNYYKLRIAESGTVIDRHIITVANYPYMFSAFSNALNSNYHVASPSGLSGFYTNNKQVRIILDPLTDDDAVQSITASLSSSRLPTVNQEFDMLVIPNGALQVIDTNEEISFVHDATTAQKIASALCLKEGDKIYDVQLLPYCPVIEKFFNYNYGNIYVDINSDLTEHIDYEYINKKLASSGTMKVQINQFYRAIPPTTTVYGKYKTTIPDTATITNEQITLRPINLPDGMILSSASVAVYNQDGYKVIGISFVASGAPIPPTNLSGQVIADVSFDYVSNDYVYQRIGVMFYCQSASFSNYIDVNLSLKDSPKIDSNCDLYRLVAPNYQGTFDFNVARNGGSVPYFTAYCTYKPYTPFIKVCPAFNYLYGTDYNDNRGLICGGDYSLPRVSSAWTTYQLNNKNYQNIFNREIQNLDFMQSIEMRNQLVSGGVGIVTDTAKGAGAGAYVGGGAGALVGGVVSGLASGIGYGIDVDTLARTQREQKQLAIDKYNYQLGNIKALPYTLTKVGSFDISSKIFPFLEYYTCSEVEKNALKNKIKYESMTVMRIGTLNEFMNFNGELNYFKGVLIRNDKIADDTHIVNAIYEELLKGVYI